VDGLEIRPFRGDDEADVVALWREAFPDDPPWNDPRAIVERKRGVQPELFLVGCDGGRVVATAIAGYDGFRGWMYHLAVAASRRRRGIGRALVAAVEGALRARGCPKVNLQVRSSNADVVRFYERLGYGVDERVSLGKRLT